MYKKNEAGDYTPILPVAGTPAEDESPMHEAGVGFVVNGPLEVLMFAVTDETTDLTVGDGKVTIRMPHAMVLVEVRGNVNTASTSGAITVDVTASGASIFSTLLTIDANEKTSVTAATAAVISNPTLDDDEEIIVNIDGAGTGAKGLKLTFLGRRAL